MPVSRRAAATRAASVPRLDLPTELVLEIASYLVDRNPLDGTVLNVSSVSRMSCTSRRMRYTLLPVLFNALPIASERHLYALSLMHPELLKYCREINILMDSHFLASMQAQSQSTSPNTPPASHYYAHAPHYHSAYPSNGVNNSSFLTTTSIYSSLVRLLSQTPCLTRLKLGVRDPSVWRAFPVAEARGISIDRALRRALATPAHGNNNASAAHGYQHQPPRLTLPHLVELHIDGCEGISPLLALAPNLRALTLALTAGFPLRMNQQLVDALQLVPRLKKLAYSADTLRLDAVGECIEDDEMESGDEDAMMGGGDYPSPSSSAGGGGAEMGSVDFLLAVGQRLPRLEELDLRARWYNERSSYFCSSSEPISCYELGAALPYLPNLRKLALPTSLAAAHDFSTLRSPLRSHSATSSSYHPSSSSPRNHFSPQALAHARRTALARVSQQERDFAQPAFYPSLPLPQSRRGYPAAAKHAMTPSSSALRSISFVRPLYEEDGTEFSVEYRRSSSAPDGLSSHVRISTASGEEFDLGPASSHHYQHQFQQQQQRSGRTAKASYNTNTSSGTMMMDSAQLWSPMCSSTLPWSFSSPVPDFGKPRGF
ncbi:hypothetical protein DL93DRAFT_2167495 [Clavulina sp. PMI_390]|nr:hypothetical protein DL93DRAFT_2167495 [Clavulina sp. PMI_390]